MNYLVKLYSPSEVPKFKNILSYQILGTQVSFSTDKVIFAIHVPILRPDTLSFVHIFPIIQDQTIFIPRYPYLAHTQTRRQFAAEICPSIEETYFCVGEFHPNDQCVEDLLDNRSMNNCTALKVNIEEPIVEQITRYIRQKEYWQNVTPINTSKSIKQYLSKFRRHAKFKYTIRNFSTTRKSEEGKP